MKDFRVKDGKYMYEKEKSRRRLLLVARSPTWSSA